MTEPQSTAHVTIKRPGPRSYEVALAWRRWRFAASELRVVYALLAVFYGGLGVSYLADPGRAVRTFSRLNQLLGGGPLPNIDVPPWRYVTAAGMTTLALMCLMVVVDLRRNHPVILPAVFFKALNAVLWFVWFGQSDLPVFLAAGILDVILVVLMVVVAHRAHPRLAAP
jgi:hypothetical protein